MVSTGFDDLDRILGDGYPDRSSVLVVGPPGIGKEALSYRLLHSGLIQGDFCLYVTRRSVDDVLKDMKAFGVGSEHLPEWIATKGAATYCDLSNLTSLSVNIKHIVSKNSDKRIRVATDILSPLLMLNRPEVMYRWWTQLLEELKQYDLVLLATAEEGMHPPDVITAMEQLFDGVIEMRLFEEGMVVIPLLRIRKMLGVPPLHGYFRFSFTQGRMEISAYAK
jgi:KaiC/GvpD/RAD55 family RecA-like ATPase